MLTTLIILSIIGLFTVIYYILNTIKISKIKKLKNSINIQQSLLDIEKSIITTKLKNDAKHLLLKK